MALGDMAQVFVLGASTTYGVGGEEGGWADMLKRHLHQKMYGEGGLGEKYQLYNFAKPGVTSDFVRETFPGQLKFYGNPVCRIAVISVGLNDTKAVGTPDGFISSLDKFSGDLRELLTDAKAAFDQVIVVGFHVYDDSKTMPRSNPDTGIDSYFSNARTVEFNKAFKNLCDQLNIAFVSPDVEDEQWIAECLWDDGFHPNGKGHAAIFSALVDVLKL